MNCKPGDIAVCVGDNPIWKGWIFEVLYAAPQFSHTLPDGCPHDPCGPDQWVLRSLSGPMRAPMSCSGHRVTWYGCGSDSGLRPLRDPDADVTRTTDREVAA